MDALETLVREALAEHAHEAPRELTVPDGRGARRWPYAVLAAAVVAAVAVGIVLVRAGSSHSSQPAMPTFAPIPAGLNEVSYHGITLQVPNNLPIGPDANCAPVGVWTEDPQSIPHCPAVVTPVGEAPFQVFLSPYEDHSQELGGRLETRQRRTDRQLDLPGPGVSIYVHAWTRAQTRAIIESIRITPIDRNGCLATLPVLDNPPAKELLPGTPSAASECIFTTELRSSHPAFLLRSLPVDPDRLARLVAAMRGLPAGPSGRSAELPGAARYLFTYANGSTRTINVTRGDDATVTDGQHVAHDPDNSIANAFD